MILNKNFFGVDEFIERFHLPDSLVTLFDLLGKMYATPKEWAYALDLAKDYPEIEDALMYMKKLYEILEIYGV